MRILFAGGDARYVYLLRMARALSHEVMAVLMENADIMDSQKIIMHDFDCEAVILPMPYRDINGYIPAPFSNEKLSFDALVKHIPQGAMVYCGGADAHLFAHADAQGFIVRDVFAEDAFAIANAVPSAEGAIYAAMRMLPITISGARTLIVGYGRLGRVLGRLLTGLSAQVCVAARSESSRAQARADGHEAISIAHIAQRLGAMRAIFNTVPSMILSGDVLSFAHTHAVLIELASRPYGIDADAAKRMGLRYALESGLPGRYSPETAARILANTIFGEE